MAMKKLIKIKCPQKSVLGTFFLILLFCFFAFRFYQSSNRKARDTELRGQIFMLASTFSNYLHVHGSFPPPFGPSEEGHLEHSWRVYLHHIIDGYSERDGAKYDFSKRWNSPENLKWADSETESLNIHYRINRTNKSNDQTSEMVALAKGIVSEDSDSKAIPKRVEDIMVLAIPNSDIHMLSPTDFTPEDAIKEIPKSLSNNSYIFFTTATGQSGKIYKDHVTLRIGATDFLKQWLGHDETPKEEKKAANGESSE